MVKSFNLLRVLFITSAMSIAFSKANAEVSHQCTASSLDGGYGFTVTGSNIGLNVLYAISGRFVSDGKGALTGTSLQTVNGNVFQSNFTASYEVANDCTGNAALAFDDGTKANLRFTLVSDGNEVLMMVSDAGTVETGSAKKQFIDLYNHSPR